MNDKRSVLLVDDDDNIRFILKTAMLKLTAWQVAEARDGLEALSQVQVDRPDLILLDVMMPRMDGVAVLQKLGQDSALQSIPVIVMSAKVQKHEIEHYLQLGARGVITKPIDPLSLPANITAILEQG